MSEGVDFEVDLNPGESEESLITFFYLLTVEKRTMVENRGNVTGLVFERRTFDGTFQTLADEPISRSDMFRSIIENAFMEMDASHQDTSVIFYHCEPDQL